MTKLGRSRRISPPQRKLVVTVLIGVLVLGALVGLYYSPLGKALFGWAGHLGEEAVPPSEVYYSFDSGGANSGTLRNIRSATIPREVSCADVGVLGNDCEFPGTAEGFVILPPEILNGKTDFSVSFWMKPGPEISTLISADNNNQGKEFLVHYNLAGDFFVYVKGALYLGEDFLRRDQKWHHLVLTRRGMDLNLHIDGSGFRALVNPLGGIGGDLVVNQFLVGKQVEGRNQINYLGSLDELRFYDRVLEQAEINQLYDEGKVACGDEISKSRTLINDVDCSQENKDALRISADNVVLDCDDHLIRAKENGGIRDYQGVIVSSNGVTVRDCRVERANKGISVQNFHNVRLEDNTLTNNDFGISLIGTSGSHIVDNELDANNIQGINIEDSHNNFIQKNRIKNIPGGNGISLTNSSGTTIGGNVAEEGNVVEKTQNGIHLARSTGNSILFNSLTDITEASIIIISETISSGIVGVGENAITIGSDRNNINHNKIRGSKVGIDVSQSTGNVLKINDVQGTIEVAVLLNNAAGSRLENNILNNNGAKGLYLKNVGAETVITQNDVCHNVVDLFCEGSTSPIVNEQSVLNSFGGREPGSGITCAGQDWPVERVHYYSCIENPNDTDGDATRDTRDNCPLVGNRDQLDTDRDGVGDVCDKDIDGDRLCNIDGESDGVCEGAEDTNRNGQFDAGETNFLDPDTDTDGICDGDATVNNVAGKSCMPGHSPDNCLLVANPRQENNDKDLTSCPTCASFDNFGDACDPDDDNDGDLDVADNCPLLTNADQANLDGDAEGNACDLDDDGDGVPDDQPDNCPLISNADQKNTDRELNNNPDDLGDACDLDDDGDDDLDDVDNCPLNANVDQLNTDDQNDGGDACDDDDDDDAIPDGRDNCPAAANPGQEDLNRNRIGDVCDNDQDGDGILEANDNCPRNRNADQLNTDGQNDGGDACDLDDDDDNINDVDATGRLLDNCSVIGNEDQSDTDEDGRGDACDDDDDADGILDVQDAFPINPSEQTDTDNDGAGDNADNCPTVRNPLVQVGFNLQSDPILAQPDTDNDGVGDACDNCRDIDNGGLTRAQCLSNENGFIAGLCEQVDTNNNNRGDACEVVVPVSTLSMNSLDDLDTVDTRLVGGRVVSVEERRQLPQSGLASESQSCVQDDCFAFDGQDYIEIRDDRLKVKRVTISLWARSDINGSRYATEAYLFNKKSGDRLGTYALGVDPGTDKMKFTIRTDQGTSYSVSAFDSLDTQWHHYVTRFDGFELGLYVDGNLSRRTVIDQPNVLLNVTGPLRIGSRPDGVAFWRGRMDELQIHDGAMDHDVIVGLYTLQKDRDSDGVDTRDDNCPAVENADQRDSDHDGLGNACDSDVDVDGDGVPNEEDNCPAVQNPGQEDLNEDGIGDACQGGAGQPCNVDRTCAGGLACSVAGRCATDGDKDNVADDDEPANCRTTAEGRKVYANGCLVGDVNADRCVNLVDITILSQSLRANFIRSSVCAAPNPALTEQQGDLNKDGCVNLIDVATLSPALRTSFDRNCR